MKTSSIDRSISNEFNLPRSKTSETNIEEKSQQKKLQFEFSSTPSLLLPKNKNQQHNSSSSSSSSEIIVSLRFKKQTKWIHRHHRQTVLSKKSRILSVSCTSLITFTFKILTKALRTRSRVSFVSILYIGTSLENVAILDFRATICSCIVI